MRRPKNSQVEARVKLLTEGVRKRFMRYLNIEGCSITTAMAETGYSYRTLAALRDEGHINPSTLKHLTLWMDVMDKNAPITGLFLADSGKTYRLILQPTLYTSELNEEESTDATS